MLQAGEEDAAAMLGEAARVLAPGGLLLSVSYGDPESRVPLFRREGWDVREQTTVLNGRATYYLYLLSPAPALGASPGTPPDGDSA